MSANVPDPVPRKEDQVPEAAAPPQEPATRPYHAPRLFVIGRATDLVQGGYGYHPDRGQNNSVNPPS
jgi:hypothetical protein